MDRLKRAIKSYGIGFLGAYLLLVGTLFLLQRTMMYFPHHAPHPEVLKTLDSFENFQVTTQDGLTLTGYFAPPQPNKPIFVMFHGNAGHPVYEVGKSRAYRESGYGILLASYRGYAGNPGRPSEEGLYADGQAFLDWLRTRPEAKASPIVMYGESLGSGVAVELTATNKDVQALILEVPFDSAVKVAEKHYPFILFIPWLLKDQYRSDEKIARINVPSLFLVAGRDEVVGVESSLRLFELANPPKQKQLFAEAHHATIYEYDPQTVVLKFLEETFP